MRSVSDPTRSTGQANCRGPDKLIVVQYTRIASIETDTGIVRLLNPTDTVKDRLLWYYLEQDGQCWQQALDIARSHTIAWRDLKTWHEREGYADEYARFRGALDK